MSKLKAVFLDRDGIINIDKEYLYKIEEFEFTKNIFDILRSLRKKGYLLFIITNQSGINRGYYNTNDFNILTAWMLERFKQEDIDIVDVKFCPHISSDNCNCRKPKTGMIEDILKNHNIDLKASWLIGDKVSDIECGNNIGIDNTILYDSGKYKTTNNCAKYIIKDINEVKEIIC